MTGDRRPQSPTASPMLCLKNADCQGHCQDGACVDDVGLGGICMTGMGCGRFLICDESSHRCRSLHAPFVSSDICFDHGDCRSTEFCRNFQCTNKLIAGGFAISGWESCADGHTDYGGICRRLCSLTGPHVVGCPVNERCSFVLGEAVAGVCLPVEHPSPEVHMGTSSGRGARQNSFYQHGMENPRGLKDRRAEEDGVILTRVLLVLFGSILLLGIIIYGIIRRKNKRKAERVTLQPVSIAVPMEVSRPAGLNSNPIMLPPPPMMPPLQMPIYTPSPMMTRPEGALYSPSGPSSPIYDQPPPAYNDLPREGASADGNSGDIFAKK